MSYYDGYSLSSQKVIISELCSKTRAFYYLYIGLMQRFRLDGTVKRKHLRLFVGLDRVGSLLKILALRQELSLQEVQATATAISILPLMFVLLILSFIFISYGVLSIFRCCRLMTFRKGHWLLRKLDDHFHHFRRRWVVCRQLHRRIAFPLGLAGLFLWIENLRLVKFISSALFFFD